MHKQLWNLFELEFTLSPKGPILIKSGVEAGADPTLPDMNFVRAINEKGESSIYLPGSSLKGVIRSHAERIANTLGVDCCDPLSREACDSRLNGDKDPSGPKVYRTLCTVCRLFGHTVMGSRIFIPDAFPSEAIATLPIRQMVAIDRRSGGSVNTFTMEVTNSGAFKSRLMVRNFERWHIGLLALVLRDLALGRIGIGFGKSRGMGQVNVEITSLSITYTTLADQDTPLVLGLGELCDENTVKDYGFMPSVLDSASAIPTSASVDTEWGQATYRLQDEAGIEEILRGQVQAWAAYVRWRQERAS